MIKRSILAKIDFLVFDKDKVIAKFLKEYPKVVIYPEVKKIQNEEILVLNMLKKSRRKGQDNIDIKARMFFNRDNEYVTQYFEKDMFKWRTGTLKNIICDITGGYFYIPSTNRILLDERKIIENYYKIKNTDQLEHIYDIQNKILEKKLEKKHKKIIEEIDRKMEIVPDVPLNFEKWVDEDVFFYDRYIFYEYTPKKIKKGHCTYCNQDVELTKVKHNERGICPCCGSPVTFKSIGKSRNVWISYMVLLPQKVNNTLIFRYFYASKDFSFSKEQKYPRNVKLFLREEVRQFCSIFGCDYSHYVYSNFKNKREIRWCEEEQGYSQINAITYTETLDEFVKGTAYEYSAIKEFCLSNKNRNINIIRYFETHKTDPKLEYFVKLKLYNLAEEYYNSFYLSMELKGKNFKQITGLNKTDLKQLQRLDATYNMIKTIKEAKEQNIRLTDEQIKIISLKLDKRIFSLTKYTTITKILNYLNKKKQKLSIANMYSDYLDYIRNCEKLKYDLSNNTILLFPKDFKKAHDETYKLAIEKDYEKYSTKLEQRYNEELKEYEFEYKDLCIKVPREAFDLIDESNQLKHCVRNYLQQMAEGKTIILFIRKKIELEKSYYTLEIYENKIKQVRGLNNCSTNKKIEEFIDKFREAKLNKKYNKVI